MIVVSFFASNLYFTFIYKLYSEERHGSWKPHGRKCKGTNYNTINLFMCLQN